MSPKNYQVYTESLVKLAQHDNRILGLIVLGSTANTHHQPDKWSDHDFWLVVEDDTQEQFHEDLSWIPNYQPIVLAFRETQHGWKIVFEDGHVLEYAIFSRDELNLARFHHYSTLVDKADIGQRLLQLKSTFESDSKQPDPLKHTQHLLSLLIIGMGRYHRGEQTSGLVFIKHHALEQLTALIQATVKPENAQLVDDLNPNRRIEFTHPQFSEQLHQIITASVPNAARLILNIVISLEKPIPNFPSSAIQTVQDIIDNA